MFRFRRRGKKPKRAPRRPNQVRPQSPPPLSSSSSSSVEASRRCFTACSSLPESSSSSSDGRRSPSLSSSSSEEDFLESSASDWEDTEGVLTTPEDKSKDLDILEPDTDYWAFSRLNTVLEVYTLAEERKKLKKKAAKAVVKERPKSAPALSSPPTILNAARLTASTSAQAKAAAAGTAPASSNLVKEKEALDSDAAMLSESLEMLHAGSTRIIAPDSSSTATGSSSLADRRRSGKNKALNTAALFAKQIEKEKRRAAGLEVTSSTTSTVDADDVAAEVRRKRRVRMVSCAHFLGRIARTCRHKTMTFIQRYCMFYVCCKHKGWSEDEIHDMHMMWQYAGRTSNSAGYVAALYKHSTLANIPKGRIDTFKARKVALRNVHVTIRHIDRAVQLCQQVTDALSFSDMYFQTKPSEEMKRMLKGRSIIGTYAWLTTYALGFLDIPKPQSEEAYEALQKLWEDVFATSIYVWSGVCHVFESIMSVLRKFEAVVAHWVINIKPYTETGERPKIERLKYADEIVHRENWRKRKEKNDKRIRHMKTHFPAWKDIPERPLLNIITRIQGTDKHWHDFDVLHWREQTKTISHFAKRMNALGNDVFELLQALDQEVFVPRKKRKRGKREPKCVQQGIRYLRRNFKAFHGFPTNMIKPEEVVEFNEIGRILLDKLDAFYVEAHHMKDVGREARHCIQLSYEYVRAKYAWPMPAYTERANKLHQNFMLHWAHHDMFQAREWVYPMNDPVSLFNSSVYQIFVKWVPCRVGRLLLSIETPEEAEANRVKTEADINRPGSKAVPCSLNDALKVPLELEVKLSEKLFPRRY